MGPEPLRARFRLPEALVLVALSACGEVAIPTSEAPGRMPLFTDVTAASGLDFVHSNGMSGELYFVENMGQGAGLFDFDRDGDLDAYLVQGAPLPANRPLAEILSETPATLPLVDRLYRNDGPDAAGIPRFVDVTATSGIVDGDYGMGVATGDADNDGWTDLYVTNFGPNHLFRNRGDGTFDDVTARPGSPTHAGIPAPPFSITTGMAGSTSSSAPISTSRSSGTHRAGRRTVCRTIAARRTTNPCPTASSTTAATGPSKT